MNETKTYSNPKRIYTYVLLPLFVPFAIIFLCGGVYLLVTEVTTMEGLHIGTFFEPIVVIVLGCLIGWVSYTVLLPGISKIVISKESVTWKCPLRKPVIISKEHCKYIGIADTLGDVKIKPILIRGDEVFYIYLSNSPLEQQYKHNIHKKACSKDFVQFPYSDRLCLDLIEVFPNVNTGSLTAFYNQLQESERSRTRKKAAKERKKEKKKQQKKK